MTAHSEHGMSPWQDFDGHEQVVVAQDAETGLKAVIALHSTSLGPALGGTRMSTYAAQPSPDWAAYQDALRLSRAMSYKNALAGLPHGGGKGVIVADPALENREILLAYGRLVQTLGGRYVTAADVGMTVADMDTVGETCRWTTGMSPERGGLGDTGILTAVGVWQGMRACAELTWGSADLAGRRIGVLGAGKVGGRLIGHLIADGADVTVADPDPQARERITATFPSITALGDPAAVLDAEWDVLSPNALGGIISMDLVPRLRTSVICGGANNPLAGRQVAGALADAGILYAPDFMVNCGGVVQAAEEALSGDLEQGRAKVMRVFDTTRHVIERARSAGITPLAAAEREAADRMSAGRFGKAGEQVG
jgi:valine dehydrogenase (NAD+)